MFDYLIFQLIFQSKNYCNIHEFFIINNITMSSSDEKEIIATLTSGLQFNISGFAMYCKAKQKMIIDNIDDKDQKMLLNRLKYLLNPRD